MTDTAVTNKLIFLKKYRLATLKIQNISITFKWINLEWFRHKLIGETWKVSWKKREIKTSFFPASFRTFLLKDFQIVAGFPLNAFAITNVQLMAALFDKEFFLKETVLFSSKPAYNWICHFYYFLSLHGHNRINSSYA